MSEADHPWQTIGWENYGRGRGWQVARQDGVLWTRVPRVGPWMPRWVAYLPDLSGSTQAPGSPSRGYALWSGTGYRCCVCDLARPLDQRQRKGSRRVAEQDIICSEVGGTPEDIEEYERGLLWDRWRRGMRRPPQYPTSWMKECMGGDLEVILAQEKGRTIGGMGVLGHGTWMMDIGIWGCAGDGLKEAAIRWGQRRGHRLYHLGGVTEDEPGIRQFKRKWGKEVEYALYVTR